jgi:formylglycine-generating enzyme
MDNLIVAPVDSNDWPDWRDELHAWRKQAWSEQGFDNAAFHLPCFDWVCDCITTHKILLWDERIYDRHAGSYRIDAYVDAFEKRFGPLDGVILWHAYPNIGFDRRNQFDFYRRMPGGLEGLRGVVDQLHQRGIRAMLDFNPWDRATRREPAPDHVALAELVGALDADGLYLDTLAEAAADLRLMLDEVKPGVVFESQSFTPLDRIADHHMSWAEVYQDATVPGVLRNAWFERRHMMHVVHRWVADHRGEMQLALMNGAGMVVWENIFGSWNGWSDRDAAWFRLWNQVRHTWSAHFSDGAWTPLAAMAPPGVYASYFEHGDVRLWVLVNRSDEWARQVPLPVSGAVASDLMAGTSLLVREGVALTDLPPRGLGAVLEDEVSASFLQGQAAVWSTLEQASGGPDVRTVAALPTGSNRSVSTPPDGMTEVDGGSWARDVSYRIRECGFYQSASAPDCQSHTLPRLHDMAAFIVEETPTPFAINRKSVTNAEFSRFLAGTGYRPRHSEAFLEDWRDGEPQSGRENHPVVWVDLEDAGAYAAWLGQRLPSEAEWQRAAELGLLEADEGAVWNWTGPQRSDGRTRFCMLKGGCDFEATGTAWYADGGLQSPAFTAKYLLMCPGLDRCGTVGFRTAVNLA